MNPTPTLSHASIISHKEYWKDQDHRIPDKQANKDAEEYNDNKAGKDKQKFEKYSLKGSPDDKLQ